MEMHQRGRVLYAVDKLLPYIPAGVLPFSRQRGLDQLQRTQHGAEVLPLHRCLQVHGLQNLLVPLPHPRLCLVCIHKSAFLPIFALLDVLHALRERILTRFCTLAGSKGHLKYGSGIRMGFANNARDAGLYDARLLCGNLLESIPPQRTMIKAYGCDDAKDRRYYVGGIQPASKAAFYYGNIHLGIRKPPESQAGSNLKETEFLSLEVRLPLLQERVHILLGDHLPIYTAAFTEIHQVRRRVQACPVARSTQCRSQHVGHGTLAVCPSHMNGFDCT